jgi:predicted ribosomally synthesized peptide with nif11-like leader
MSNQTAEQFIDRLVDDEVLAEKFAAMVNDPEAVRAALAAEGVDAEPLEIFDAMVDKFDIEMTEEQLAAVAGGMDGAQIAAIAVASASGAVLVTAAAVGAAAAAMV